MTLVSRACHSCAAPSINTPTAICKVNCDQNCHNHFSSWPVLTTVFAEFSNLVQRLVCNFSYQLVNIFHQEDTDYGNTGHRVFMQRVQNWKDVCLKINISKGNYWTLRIGVIGRCQKVPKFDFQIQFSTSKIIWIFLIFFHWRISVSTTALRSP